jgi:probable non-F420 flavinoid oxidoreductase
MARYGFHASHEQIAPSQLLRDVQSAERAGFDMAMCSDHFAPWSMDQGHSGLAWSWLGAALATTSLRFGTVTAPGQRYHPAVVGQMIATLGEMFPGRFWIALGSGQNMNEHVTGDRWLPKDVRQERLEESVAVIRRLLAGEEVTHEGLVRVDRARIYSLPEEVPPLIGPALSPPTAERAAHWADGLVTINAEIDEVRAIVEAYRGAGGHGPMAIQVHVALADSLEEARAIARHQWRNHALDFPLGHDLPTPEHFDAAGKHVDDDAIAGSVIVTDSTAELVEKVRAFEELGFEEVYLHHVGQDQAPFLERAERELLPALRAA